ncbi:MAG: hypothetical protein J7K31_01195 [Candidatus Aenigmarchaeota archaeon]|nr:hypothetical protein [Candidatus Aenigmarchaeota archaeon]
MNKMKFKSIWLIYILIMITVILVSGCIDQRFSPSVGFKLDKYSITVDDNTVSSEFVKATITRLDNENISTVFVMKFFPQTPEDIYPVDVDGNEISELSTRPLKAKGAEDILQFKVFGKKGGFTEAKSKIRIELWWNNTKIENTDRILEVSVR